MDTNTVITTIALVIAIWQLYLQRKELIRNSRINSLIYLIEMLEKRKKLHEKIIKDIQASKEYKDYKGHTKKINKEINPLIKRTQDELLSIIAKKENIEYIERIERVINNKNQ